MHKRNQLFLTIIICCAKIQTSQQRSVVKENQVEIAVVPFQHTVPQVIADDYGSTSSVATSSVAGEIDSSGGSDQFLDTYMRIGCCPCFSLQVRHPKLYSCCCDNSCGKYIFACCMT